MIRKVSTLSLLPLAFLFFYLTNFQRANAQTDPLTCFLYPSDPKCGDLDNDGVLNENERKGEETDPCKPYLLNDVCMSVAEKKCRLNSFLSDNDPLCQNIIKVVRYENERQIRNAIQSFTLKDNNHLPIRIPNVLGFPGTIISIDDPLRFGDQFDIVCRPKQVLGENFRPIISPTLGSVEKGEALITFDWETKAKIGTLLDLDAEGRWKDFDSFTLSFTEVSILSLAKADIFKIRTQDGTLTEECKEAIRHENKNGNIKNLTLITSAIQANVDSSLNLIFGETAGVKAEIGSFLKELASVGGGTKYSVENQDLFLTEGNIISLGMITNSALFKIIYEDLKSEDDDNENETKSNPPLENNNSLPEIHNLFSEEYSIWKYLFGY